MATGAATAAAAVISLPLGQLVAWLVWPAAAYTLRVAELFADLPGASLSLPPFATAGVVVAYATMIGAVWAARSSRARSVAAAIVRVGGPAWLVVLFSLTAAIWRIAGELPDARLTLTAFPNGSVLIETPTGRFVALVPGPGSAGLAETFDSQLPFSHRRLDWLVLTDPEATNLGLPESS
jgi:hypothetical protein